MVSSLFGHSIYCKIGAVSGFGRQTTLATNENLAIFTPSAENAFAVGVKGYHHFTDTTYFKYNDINVNRGTSYVNFMINENLKKMNTDKYILIGDVLNVDWDSPDS